MSRGPSPPQICLLLLIDTYCKDHVPENARLQVLAFIASHLLPQGTLQSRNPKHPSQAANGLNLDSFKELLSSMSSTKESQSLWDIFRQQILAIGCLDDWFDFLANVTTLFSEDMTAAHEDRSMAVIAAPSLFGTAVRRMYLDYKTLDFQVAVQCWQAFEHFTAGIRPSASRQRAEILRLGSSTTSDIGSLVNSNVQTSSTSTLDALYSADTEKLLSFQIDSMQKLGNRLPQDVLAQLQANLGHSQHNANLMNYVEFLDAWYSGDYPTSFEKLHRYYDYAMLNKDRSQYQYALLNTAILQADFGCRREAVAAMQETISTARENKDIPCLNFSMSWLYHFRTIYGEDVSLSGDNALIASDGRSLQFLKVRAQEGKMWSIVSATLLNESRLYLAQGHRPAVAVDRIYESSFLNVRHGIRGMKGAQSHVQATLFDRLGLSGLAMSHRNLITSGLLQEIPTEDLVRARCQMSYVHTLRGNYKEAKACLDQCKADCHRLLKCHQLIQVTSVINSIKQHLHQHELQLAHNQLQAAAAAPFLDKHISFEIALLELDYLDLTGDYETMLAKADSLAQLDQASGNVDAAHCMRLMNRKASIAARLGKPQKGLSLCLRSLIAAVEARLVPAMCEAAAALGGVLLAVEELEAAANILEAVAWTAQELGNAALVATIQNKSAEVALCHANAAAASGTRTHRLRQSLMWSEKAYATYLTLGDTFGQYSAAERSAQLSSLLGDNSQAEMQKGIAKALSAKMAQTQ